MTWWLISTVVTAMGFFGWLLCTFKKEGDVAAKHLRHAHRKQMFRVAEEEREILEHFAKNNPHKISKLRPGESPWNYMRRLADEGSFGPLVKPWEPSWGSHAYVDVSVCITQQCWTTVIEGVRHRVGKLTLTDGTIANTLLCDPSNFVDSPVDTHDIDRCPTITCLGCVTKEG